MENKDRLISAYTLQRKICGARCGCEYEDCGCEGDCIFDFFISNTPTVDAYTAEQVADILIAHEATNTEMEKELIWLKSCLNCKIRRDCTRHCGKVVHNCDHWEYGDPTVHGYWIVESESSIRCSECCFNRAAIKVPMDYCPHCGATMDA